MFCATHRCGSGKRGRGDVGVCLLMRKNYVAEEGDICICLPYGVWETRNMEKRQIHIGNNPSTNVALFSLFDKCYTKNGVGARKVKLQPSTEP
ncbi:hypothetical protein N7466_010017 [Penicillium verhagenii]|uniref:uncharacterized protein n=1 Tax=Penicillium verhagenii TaxID=1562060 RepID=UPI0025457C51|nr:uncharacterized protein N7466_010017 [Penicillium verhagenii]KAJ5919074.1 hypothetical protein N7466_010017 [Penicillium verhagenii]